MKIVDYHHISYMTAEVIKNNDSGILEHFIIFIFYYILLTPKQHLLSSTAAYRKNSVLSTKRKWEYKKNTRKSKVKRLHDSADW